KLGATPAHCRANDGKCPNRERSAAPAPSDRGDGRRAPMGFWRFDDARQRIAMARRASAAQLSPCALVSAGFQGLFQPLFQREEYTAHAPLALPAGCDLAAPVRRCAFVRLFPQFPPARRSTQYLPRAAVQLEIGAFYSMEKRKHP